MKFDTSFTDFTTVLFLTKQREQASIKSRRKWDHAQKKQKWTINNIMLLRCENRR